jgi:hypothetical protein
MSTSINFVTKYKDILFIAEVRGDGGNTTGYNSTSTEYYTADIVIVTLGVTLGVSTAFLIVVFVYVFYKCKDIFFTTF